MAGKQDQYKHEELDEGGIGNLLSSIGLNDSEWAGNFSDKLQYTLISLMITPLKLILVWANILGKRKINVKSTWEKAVINLIFLSIASIKFKNPGDLIITSIAYVVSLGVITSISGTAVLEKLKAFISGSGSDKGITNEEISSIWNKIVNWFDKEEFEEFVEELEVEGGYKDKDLEDEYPDYHEFPTTEQPLKPVDEEESGHIDNEEGYKGPLDILSTPTMEPKREELKKVFDVGTSTNVRTSLAMDIGENTFVDDIIPGWGEEIESKGEGAINIGIKSKVPQGAPPPPPDFPNSIISINGPIPTVNEPGTFPTVKMGDKTM